MIPIPIKRPPKTIKVIDAIGAGVVLVMISFVVGNRWSSILTNVTNQTNLNKSLPVDLDYTEVEQVYDLLRTNYDGELNVNELLDGLKRGLAEATGDEHTIYLSEQESQDFLSDLNGTFTGIGAELGLENDRIIIVSPLDGFPAQKAGLRAKDVVFAINGEDTFGISIEEAISKIRGEKGTDVTLTILRGGEQFNVTITRDEITVPSVTTELKDGVGILRISRFGEDTVELASKAAEDFKRHDVKGVILDLRNNSGGYLEGAVDISSLWLEDQVVVEQRRGEQVMERLRSGRQAPLNGLPTAVLINEGSASASEIVAGALKDNNAAKLIGQTSFGKGSVQELEYVKSGGTLKVTIARWYTPNGNNIDETGIKPDIEVELTEKDIKAGRDPQFQRAISELQ